MVTAITAGQQYRDSSAVVFARGDAFVAGLENTRTIGNPMHSSFIDTFIFLVSISLEEHRATKAVYVSPCSVVLNSKTVQRNTSQLYVRKHTTVSSRRRSTIFKLKRSLHSVP